MQSPAGLIEEGERKANLERERREQEQRERDRKEAEARAAKARSESRQDLLHIVNAWSQAKGIEEFFADAESRLAGLDPDQKRDLGDRLKHARFLTGSLDALQRFRRWQAPDERVAD